MAKKVYQKPVVEFWYFDTDILRASNETLIGIDDDFWTLDEGGGI